MKTRRRVAWTIVLAGLALAVSFFVLGFLSEPSATGRVRVALYVVGVGFALIGAGAGVAVLWILLRRRT